MKTTKNAQKFPFAGIMKHNSLGYFPILVLATTTPSINQSLEKTGGLNVSEYKVILATYILKSIFIKISYDTYSFMTATRVFVAFPVFLSIFEKIIVRTKRI